MRKLFSFPIVILGILIVLQSCSKQSTNNTIAPVRTNVINATIAPNGTYQLSADNSAVVSISKQASHFQVSQTEIDSKSGSMVYKYVPVADYRGIDEVVLSSTKASITTGSGGCNGNHNSNSDNTSYSITYTTVKINITN